MNLTNIFGSTHCLNFLLYNRYYVEILSTTDKSKHINMFNGFILLEVTGDLHSAVSDVRPQMRSFDFHLFFYDILFLLYSETEGCTFSRTSL